MRSHIMCVAKLVTDSRVQHDEERTPRSIIGRPGRQPLVRRDICRKKPSLPQILILPHACIIYVSHVEERAILEIPNDVHELSQNTPRQRTWLITLNTSRN